MAAMRLSAKYTRILAALSLLLLGGMVLVLWFETELSRPWKRFQRDFVKLDGTLTEVERAEINKQPDSPEKKEQLSLLAKRQEGIDCRKTAIKQLWLTDFGVADRCITCHQGVESPRFAQAPQPLTAHPGHHLAADHHPVERFGCVVCHDGQGVALTTKEAHGETALWLDPVLKGELAEASCRRCHAYDDRVPEHLDFPEAPHLSNGKKVYLQKECMGCHVLDGFERPQRIGPILTRVAEKVEHGWLARWIARPKEYLPQTIMPFFSLDKEQVDQLGSFLSSLRKEEGADAAGSGDPGRGKKLVEEKGCLACHTVGERGGVFGPDLNRVAEKLTGPSWLLRWLKDPVAYDSETEMPNFRLTCEQTHDIAAFLLTLKKQEHGAAAPFDAGQVEQGRQLFAGLGCTGCHKVDTMVYGFPSSPEHTGFADKGMDMFDFGQIHNLSPELKAQLKRTHGEGLDVEALAKKLKTLPRTRAAWTAQKLETPRVYSTETIQLKMPDFGLSPEEIRDLRVFLFSFKDEQAPQQYHQEFWNKADPFINGMRIVEKYNCTGCHKMGLVPREVELNDDFPEGYFWAAESYALEDISRDGKLLYAKGAALSASEVEALLAGDKEMENLLFRHHWFVDYDAAGYLMDMGITKVKLLGMDEGDIMANYKDLNFAPPILHYEGWKVQPNWLFSFLDNPYPVRPLTRATMPTFNLSEQEITDLVAFFTAKEGLVDNPYFPVQELNGHQTGQAEGVFKICLQCHVFEQERVLEAEHFGDLKGPNMAEIKRRLRPEYIRNWVQFPDLVIPGTQMKNFFYDFDFDNRFAEIVPDETGITDISQDEKIDMMARFLMNPYKNARLSVQR